MKRDDQVFPPPARRWRRAAPAWAGQHLPIRIKLPGEEKGGIRTYTLSVAPSDGDLPPSASSAMVKVSQFSMIASPLAMSSRRARRLAISASHARSTRPAVLLAGGVGITPMLAMSVIRLRRAAQAACPSGDAYSMRPVPRLIDRSTRSRRINWSDQGRRTPGQGSSATPPDAEEGRDFDARGGSIWRC